MQEHSEVTNTLSQTDSDFESDIESESAQLPNEDPNLTRQETRQIVTPYAFFVSDELLGTPLAGPFRRGFGLTIDLIFISMLSQMSSLVLATVAAWTFFRAGNRLKTKKRFNGVRIALRLGVAVLLFIVAMGIVDAINEEDLIDDIKSVSSTNNNDDDSIDGMEVLALTGAYLLETKTMKGKVANKECEPAYDCLLDLGEKLIDDIAELGLDKETINGFLEGYLASVSEMLSDEQLLALTDHLQQFVESKDISSSQNEEEIGEQNSIVANSAEPNPESTSFIDWMENLAEELGLGLGWAAFYFSIFTAWWKGQTPGKKLLGMKVIKLDNKPLNLWESFGRYGGYAAGLATGLMGFLQVFWDPNRQAIQDKISETLVIYTRKPKVPFVKGSLGKPDGQ
jgi:hypothetical protein